MVRLNLTDISLCLIPYLPFAPSVRNRSRELAELLSDLDKVRQERRKAKANRSKYTGVGNDGSGGGGPSFTSASGSRYGGFGSDSLGSGSGQYLSGSLLPFNEC